jgi:hypothetical protein
VRNAESDHAGYAKQFYEVLDSAEVNSDPLCFVQTEESAVFFAVSCDLWSLNPILWAAVQAGQSAMSIIVSSGLTALAEH